MKITTITLENIRGFKKLDALPLSDTINVFIGHNNSGKSTILNAIYRLQNEDKITSNDVTIGQTMKPAAIYLGYKGKHKNYINFSQNGMIIISTKLSVFNKDNDSDTSHYEALLSINKENLSNNFTPFSIPSKEPDNLIYPYHSKRKTAHYSSDISEEKSNLVKGDLSQLYSKIDRINNPDVEPHYTYYKNACENILGFKVSTKATNSGKEAVYYVEGRNEYIPLTAMGEGVPNILGLIIDLCIAEDKIFLIEELENDIHPKALKGLLDLIIEKSATNQFFISTHSHIVMKHLGAAPEAKLFHVTNDERDEVYKKLSLSKVTEVPSTPEARREVLEYLGYELFDFDLWKGWLFLEESSAEQIIRDFLIPWFVDDLQNKIRTYSAQSITSIEVKFEDFNRLFVFMHLTPTYKNKVWVIIDGNGINGDEQKIIEKMREDYTKSGWDSNNFRQFSEHDFETYYPAKFQEQAKEILSMPHKTKEERGERRNKKRDLVKEVVAWLNTNPTEGKIALRKSAKEVIELLEEINASLKKMS